jgi:hypothetical protein
MAHLQLWIQSASLILASRAVLRYRNKPVECWNFAHPVRHQALFVVVLPGTTLHTALEVAERLRIGVGKSPLLTTPLVTVTVSIGAAVLIPERTAEDLLNAADTAVYAAKRGGRNQVRSSENLTVQS